MRSAFQSYRSTAGWFFRDAILRHWTYAVLVVTTGLASTASKVGAVTVIVYFATHASQNEPIRVMGRELDPRDSMTPLVLASVVSASLYLLSAAFQYIERRGTYASWGAHAEVCAKRALLALDDPRVTLSGYRHSSDPGSFQRLVNGHANTTGRVLSIALGTFAPMLTLLGALAVMMFISPTITLVLLATMLILIPVHVFIYVRAAKASEQSTLLAPPHAQAFRDLAAPVFAQEQSDSVKEEVESLFESGPVRAYRDAYIKRFRCFAESELLIGITAALAILVLVIGLGWWSLEHEQGWGTLLTYLVTLQFAFGSIGTLIKRMASINRFYPEVSAYHEFDLARRGLQVAVNNSSPIQSITCDDDLDEID
ncbi:MAG: hypothetical protein JJ974_10280 [Phycisphaerales bacterium]|nr:hypothetical protein [Phycisphaerales bacterium]